MIIFTPQVMEYELLRMIRRFVFPYSLLLRIGHLIPCFQVNANQDAAVEVADTYRQLLWEHNLGFIDWVSLCINDSTANIGQFAVDENLYSHHAPFNDIRKLGRGRFNHWGKMIFFSTSDNSAPRTNGRTYEVR